MNTERDTEDYLPTRESLLSRLRNIGDEESWKDFFETYWKLLYKVARRAGLGEVEAEDVVQETILTVVRKMPEFRYNPAVGSFKSWLLTLTRSRINDYFRKKIYHRDGQVIAREAHLDTSVLAQQPAPAGVDLDEVWNDEWHQSLVERATERVKQEVSPREYQLFYLQVYKEMSASDVAARLQVSRTKVYLAKYKVGTRLKKAIRALERDAWLKRPED